MNEESYTDQFVSEVPITYVPKASNLLLQAFDPCSCISYAKYRSGLGIGQSWGYPNKMEVYPIQPYVGGLAITTEGRYGHVAYIEAIHQDYILVSEANYHPPGTPCTGLITKRSIRLDAPIIRGFR